VNYAKLLEISSFFTWHIFLEVGKTQDIPSKIWQTLGDALITHLLSTGHAQNSPSSLPADLDETSRKQTRRGMSASHPDDCSCLMRKTREERHHHKQIGGQGLTTVCGDDGKIEEFLHHSK